MAIYLKPKRDGSQPDQALTTWSLIPVFAKNSYAFIYIICISFPILSEVLNFTDLKNIYSKL